MLQYQELVISQRCTATCPRLPVGTGKSPVCEPEWEAEAGDLGLASHIRAAAVSGDALVQVKYCSPGFSLLRSLQTVSVSPCWISSLHGAESCYSPQNRCLRYLNYNLPCKVQVC